MAIWISLVALGVSVGCHWGVAPAIAAVSSAFVLMPYKYSITR